MRNAAILRSFSSELDLRKLLSRTPAIDLFTAADLHPGEAFL